MTTGIQKVPSHISQDYAHLFEMGDRVANLKNRDVDDIILETCRKDREIQFGRKVVYFDSRRLIEDRQASTSESKKGTYLNRTELFIQGAGATCHAFATLLPVLTALAQALEATGRYQGNVNSARLEEHGFSSQRLEHLLNAHNQQIQETDKENAQDDKLVDNLIQSMDRQNSMLGQ